MTDALIVGMTADEFWKSTPKELAYYSDAYNFKTENTMRLAGWVSWNTAALPRTKKMPGLKQFLGSLFGKKRTQTPDQQLQLIEALNAQLKGKDERIQK